MCSMSAGLLLLTSLVANQEKSRNGGDKDSTGDRILWFLNDKQNDVWPNDKSISKFQTIKSYKPQIYDQS